MEVCSVLVLNILHAKSFPFNIIPMKWYPFLRLSPFKATGGPKIFISLSERSYRAVKDDEDRIKKYCS